MHILLIDDSAAYHEEFGDLLADAPFADAVLECVGNAVDGARIMNRGEHDIYFVDYRLPGDTGLSLIEGARKVDVDRPIILLTGFDSPLIDRAAEQAGANDYLPKGGFSAETLGRAIRYALRNAASVRQARHARKLETLGQIASGVAHDFNNILQTISGCMELVLADLAPDSPSHEFLTTGLRSAGRGAALTHNLLAYARKQMLRPCRLALPPLLAELEALLIQTLDPAIAVSTTLGPKLPGVLVDPCELQAALVNLARNAAQAMPQGGVLAIGACEAVTDGKTWVVLSVTDTGTGMDAHTLARATEPFFTTKGVAGTGLGLSSVQGFVIQSAGQFDIKSAVGRGTTVELHLPAAAAERDAVVAWQPDNHRRPALPLPLVGDDLDPSARQGRLLDKAG